MATSRYRVAEPAVKSSREFPIALDDSQISRAALSTALTSVFRGRFCDAILPGRKPATFKKDQVIYGVGDKERTFFFLQSGFVKVGTITPDGHELIYDVRKEGDVVGELCASEPLRPDRAVALEQTKAIPVPFQDVLEAVGKQPILLQRLVEVFCQALSEAYAQVNTLAADDIPHRLCNILLKLAAKIGKRSGPMVEISTYLTQEEIAQMVASRRERVSTALNLLRRRGMVDYTKHGRLVLNVKDLEKFSAS